MKKGVKIAFLIFNIIYFFFDYIVVTVLPNPVLFGWLPLQLGILLFLPVPAAIVWGIYFNAFFKTQKDLK